MTQTVKNPPAIWKAWVLSLSGENPTPVFLPGESPGREVPGRLLCMWSQRVEDDLAYPRERERELLRLPTSCMLACLVASFVSDSMGCYLPGPSV